jgi:hypothetical protein
MVEWKYDATAWLFGKPKQTNKLTNTRTTKGYMYIHTYIYIYISLLERW